VRAHEMASTVVVRRERLLNSAWASAWLDARCRGVPAAWQSSLVSRRRGLSATYVGWAGPSVSSAGTRQVEPLTRCWPSAAAQLP